MHHATNRTVLSIVTAVVLVTGLGPLAARAAAAATTRPNILFLFADDQRPDTVSAYGNPHIRTPNVDRLAASGMRLASRSSSTQSSTRRCRNRDRNDTLKWPSPVLYWKILFFCGNC